MQQFTEAMAALVPQMQQLAEALKPLKQFIRQFKDVVGDAYDDAGQPYGDSEEGMWQWAKECASDYREAVEAAEEANWQRHLASLQR